MDKEEGDSGIDANSQGSCSSNDVKAKEKRKDKKKKKSSVNNSHTVGKADNDTTTEASSLRSSTSTKSHSPLSTTSDTKERLSDRYRRFYYYNVIVTDYIMYKMRYMNTAVCVCLVQTWYRHRSIATFHSTLGV